MDSADHILQAEHNERLYEALDRVVYSDWAMTSLFYAALHYVDALILQNGVQPDSHQTRNRKVSQLTVLKPILRQYLDLKARSQSARYDGYSYSTEELVLSKNDLESIKKQVLRNLRR